MNKTYTYLTVVFAFFFLLIKNDRAQTVNNLSGSKFESSANHLPQTKEDLSSRAEWEFMRLRDPRTNKIPDNISFLEREYAKSLPNEKMIRLQKGSSVISSGDWTYRGPYNQGGRSRAIAVDVNDSNIILAGGTTGGMWRSTDNGLSWTKVTPAQDTVQTVTCIVQDTRQGKTNIWYYGTGEYASNLELQDNGAGFTTVLGAGIYKSTDDGITWNRLTSTVPNYSPTFFNPFQIVWNISIDNSNSNEDIVYAAVYGGVFRSSDGGSTWTEVLGNNSNNAVYSNAAVTSKGDVFAALSNGNVQGIWHSEDGINWSDITPANFPNVYARIVIANAASNSNILYVLANTPGSGNPGSNDGGTDDYNSLWKYDSSNKQWTDLSNNLPATSGKVGGYSSQNSYDMMIKVSPADENFVIIGGTNLYRTTNGFSSKVDSTNWIGGYSTANDISSYQNQHPDEHDLYFLPSNPKVVYSANDGGLSYTTDVSAAKVVWTNVNNGFNTTQFYSVALDHATANSPLIVGGMQDNGNMMDTTWNANSNWIVLPGGGDGCTSAVSDGGGYIYFATQNGEVTEIRGSDNQGATIKPVGASGFLFVAPYILDPVNSNIFYLAAGRHIWKNSDVQSIPMGTDSATTLNWVDMKNLDTSNTISSLAGSRLPAHILYYGTSNGKLYKVTNADQDNYSVKEITSSNFPNGFISSIAVDPANANNVLVDFSNYNILSLFFTSDGGSTWTPVSGNLEQNSDGSGSGPSVRSVRILNLNGNLVYYAGTSTGLYAADNLDGMNTKWIQQSPDGIGMVDVETLDARDIDGTVIAGTFANGVYSAKYTATGISRENNIPLTYSLYQNYPNPFNPSTIIRYELPKSGNVQINIYDALGKEVRLLIDEEQNAGTYNILWDGNNNYGQRVSSGIYFYRIVTGSFVQTKKMILMK